MAASQLNPTPRVRRGGRTPVLGTLLALLSLLFGVMNFVRLRPLDLRSQATQLLALRALAAALSPVWAVLGYAAALAGARNRRPLVSLAGLAGSIASLVYIRRVAAVTPLAPPAERTGSMPRVKRDIAFYTTIEPAACGGGPRPVYCDVWQPGEGARRSGVGIVYLHGSAWYLGDKAQLTDPMLRVWASRGHVVMDVAYRMCPETDLRGMMVDAWAAVAWLKAYAAELEIDPDRIVLSGTSAGGHVALLAAYTADESGRIPPGVPASDVSVAGVFAMSAPVDMDAMLEYHTHVGESARPQPGLAYDPLTDPDPVVPPGPGASRRARMQWQRAQMRRLSGLLRDLLGGGPDDSPEMFALATVGNHVRPGLPPTLLIQGAQDALVPVEPTRKLYRKLLDAGVRAQYLEMPLTDHAFEIAVPQISPPARAANAAISRFLAEI